MTTTVQPARPVAGRRLTSTWALTVALASGCATRPAASPAGGGVRDLAPAEPARAVGVWVGAYEGRTYGRAGAFELELREAEDGARLDGVVRLALSRDPPRRPLGAAPASAPRVAAVRVARATARGDTLRLVTEAFWDPGCGCTATLSLTGRLRGDSLGGRYRAESAPTVAPEGDGRWRAVRVPPAPLSRRP